MLRLGDGKDAPWRDLMTWPFGENGGAEDYRRWQGPLCPDDYGLGHFAPREGGRRHRQETGDPRAETPSATWGAITISPTATSYRPWSLNTSSPNGRFSTPQSRATSTNSPRSTVVCST